MSLYQSQPSSNFFDLQSFNYPITYIARAVSGLFAPPRRSRPSNASQKQGMPKSRPRSLAPATGPELPVAAGNSPDTQTADASLANPSLIHRRGRTLSFPRASAPPTRQPG